MRNGELSKTVVDISLVSSGLSPYTRGWRVRNGCPISDHRSTEFVIKLDGQTLVKKRNWSTANWKKFIEYLEQKGLFEDKWEWKHEDLQRVSCH